MFNLLTKGRIILLHIYNIHFYGPKLLKSLYLRAKSKNKSYIPYKVNLYPYDNNIRPIAFYLPQFHPIHENDMNWGKGFTEWTNVTKAVPQFPEHYQPHLPDELGFYDLRLPDIQKRQMEIAKNYGIYGFCYHYYWFNGKKVLDLPLNRILNQPDLDFPFCICWANENWTRRWDGLENDILLKQEHNEESDIGFIHDVDPILRDPRYIKIKGFPVLIIYRPLLFPDPKKTALLWRKYCREKGIGEIYLLGVQGFGFKDPRDIGFDGVLEFPPLTMGDLKDITKKVHITNTEFTGKVYDYWVFVHSKQYLEPPPYIQYKTVCPGWDNTARRPTQATIFHRVTPDVYQEWLADIISYTQKVLGPDEQYFFINAWNEWAEGAHLEPDRKFGFGFLKATYDALQNSFNNITVSNKIVIVSHDAYYHGAQLLILNVAKFLNEQFKFSVEFILKNGGPLEKEFSKIGPVFIYTKNTSEKLNLDSYVKNLYSRGYKFAICNTVVTGDITKILINNHFRVIHLIHELPGLISDNNLWGNLNSINQYADKIVFPSQYVLDKIEKIIPMKKEKLIIRPQGLFSPMNINYCDEEVNCLKNKLNLPLTSIIVLSVGYGDKRKGIDVFLQVAEKVVANCLDIHFIWIGHYDKQFVDNSFKTVNKLKIEKNVHLLGLIPLENINPYFFIADIFFLPSREDPFPSVVLQAMDSGLPVVAFSDAGGFTDVVTDKTGILIPYLDIEQSSNSILELAMDNAKRINLGKKAHELMKTRFLFSDYVLFLLNQLGVTITKKVEDAYDKPISNLDSSSKILNTNLKICSNHCLSSIKQLSQPCFESNIRIDGEVYQLLGSNNKKKKYIFYYIAWLKNKGEEFLKIPKKIKGFHKKFNEEFNTIFIVQQILFGHISNKIFIRIIDPIAPMGSKKRIKLKKIFDKLISLLLRLKNDKLIIYIDIPDGEL